MRTDRGGGRCVVVIIVVVFETTVLALLVGPVGLADVKSGARTCYYSTDRRIRSALEGDKPDTGGTVSFITPVLKLGRSLVCRTYLLSGDVWCSYRCPAVRPGLSSFVCGFSPLGNPGLLGNDSRRVVL